MWAQDTAAMQGYAVASASATTLTPFSEPAATTDPNGLPGQPAAVCQATGTAAGEAPSAASSAQRSLSAVPDALASLANPAGDGLSWLDWLDIFDVELGVAGVTGDTILATFALPYDIAGYHGGIDPDDIINGWAGIERWSGLGAVPASRFPVISNVGSPVHLFCPGRPVRVT